MEALLGGVSMSDDGFVHITLTKERYEIIQGKLQDIVNFAGVNPKEWVMDEIHDLADFVKGDLFSARMETFISMKSEGGQQ